MTDQSELTIEVTVRDPHDWRTERLSVRAPDYLTWCGALVRGLEESAGADTPIVTALLAEETTQPRSRVRVYRGFSFYHLDGQAADSTGDRTKFEIAEGAYAVGGRAEFLFAILSANRQGSVEVARLALTWASNSIVLLPTQLTVQQAAAAFTDALRISPEGSAAAVRWNRSALHAALPGAMATVGLSGLNIGRTLTYEALLAEPLLNEFAASLARHLPVVARSSP